MANPQASKLHVVDVSQLMRLVEEVRAKTAKALDELVENLESASCTDVEQDFAGLVKASQQLLRVDDLELARALNVSRPTIGRWTRGDSAPHRLARPAVFEVLIKKARAQVRELRG
ncbi:hypothetical protein [Sphingomonas sp. ABOLE]|uniref:hypothetical protein n=1 Tax=Sphingomonas sp. ABOLE TaxID=1985878 RepID=UPI000F7EC802|nr:hypothetical protein [Sphingomonas sp. ABOLE]